MSGRVLILDDKAPDEDFSTFQALSRLAAGERSLVEYFATTETLWVENYLDDDIKLMRDFSHYPFIFIHDSFENSLVSDGLKGIVIEKLSKTSKVVLFSGSRTESEVPIERIYDEQISKDTACYEILRRQYFHNLKNFIDSFLVRGEYQIKYLYNPYINPKKDQAYTLFEVIKADLEQSIQKAIESSSFTELLTLYGYEDISDISNRFLKMSDDDFVENLEDLIENN